MSAINSQIGGNHYKDCAIQPVEYIHANGIGYFEGCAIKYLTRWKSKGGVQDLEKAKHYIELLIELENNNEREQVIKAAETKSDWIQWNGGEFSPVTSLTDVIVKFGDGMCDSGVAADYDWTHVVAYKRKD